MSQKRFNFNDVFFAIYDMTKKIFHAIEKIIIDIVCRRLVIYYDNKYRKSKKCHNKELSSSNVDKAAECQEVNIKLQETICTLNKEIEHLKNELADAIECRDEVIKTNEIFSKTIEELRNTTRSFSKTKAASLQQTEKPVQQKVLVKEAKISCLYAEPDASGAILRKTSTTESRYSLYKLNVSESNEQLCTFCVINNEATETYIANRNVSLQACQIIELSSSPTTFVNIEPGTAVKENNIWVVASPAKIKII